jgi:hypothetical protein
MLVVSLGGLARGALGRMPLQMPVAHSQTSGWLVHCNANLQQRVHAVFGLWERIGEIAIGDGDGDSVGDDVGVGVRSERLACWERLSNVSLWGFKASSNRDGKLLH